MKHLQLINQKMLPLIWKVLSSSLIALSIIVVLPSFSIAEEDEEFELNRLNQESVELLDQERFILEQMKTFAEEPTATSTSMPQTAKEIVNKEEILVEKITTKNQEVIEEVKIIKEEQPIATPTVTPTTTPTATPTIAKPKIEVVKRKTTPLAVAANQIPSAQTKQITAAKPAAQYPPAKDKLKTVAKVTRKVTKIDPKKEEIKVAEVKIVEEKVVAEKKVETKKTATKQIAVKQHEVKKIEVKQVKEKVTQPTPVQTPVKKQEEIFIVSNDIKDNNLQENIDKVTTAAIRDQESSIANELIATVFVDKADIWIDPRTNNKASFQCAKGEVVSVETRMDDWYRIISSKGRGWIKTKNVVFKPRKESSLVRIMGYDGSVSGEGY